MSSEIFGYEGFKDLADIIEYYAKGADNVVDVLETGASEFTSDLLKLPRPISKIRKAGYTHLVRTFAYRKKKDEIEVGWGKYYGPMVENGTVKMMRYSNMRTSCFWIKTTYPANTLTLTMQRIISFPCISSR